MHMVLWVLHISIRGILSHHEGRPIAGSMKSISRSIGLS